MWLTRNRQKLIPSIAIAGIHNIQLYSFLPQSHALRSLSPQITSLTSIIYIIYITSPQAQDHDTKTKKQPDHPQCNPQAMCDLFLEGLPYHFSHRNLVVFLQWSCYYEISLTTTQANSVNPQRLPPKEHSLKFIMVYLRIDQLTQISNLCSGRTPVPGRLVPQRLATVQSSTSNVTM